MIITLTINDDGVLVESNTLISSNETLRAVEALMLATGRYRHPCTCEECQKAASVLENITTIMKGNLH